MTNIHLDYIQESIEIEDGENGEHSIILLFHWPQSLFKHSALIRDGHSKQIHGEFKRDLEVGTLRKILKGGSALPYFEW